MQRRPTLLRRLFAPAIRRAGGFARNDEGVTLIEFGILAVPFFTIVAAILETAMVFFAMQVLDSAVDDASRIVKTGQAQATANFDIDDFRELMCSYTFGLFGDCSGIKIQIKPITNFSSATYMTSVTTCTAPPNSTCQITMPEQWTPGKGRDVIQVFAYYRWPLLISFPYFNLRNQPDNYRLLGATRVFRNEPFQSSS